MASILMEYQWGFLLFIEKGWFSKQFGSFLFIYFFYSYYVYSI